MRKLISISFLLSIAFLLQTACTIVKPIPDQFSILINTASDLNPDNEGRPSPLVIRIYELNDDKMFKDKDFFDLYDNDSDVLEKTLLKKQEMELNPNESRKLDLILDEKTTHIAFLAAYRDIDNATWRESIQIKSKKSTGLLVQEKRSIVVDLKKNKIVTSLK